MKEIYVAPDLGSGGSGIITDPYGNLQGAIAAEAWDTTGMRYNIKQGADQVLTASVSAACISQSYAPAIQRPLIFRGYSAVAEDGGKGSIDGNGSIAVWDSPADLDFVSFVDLHCGNTGAQNILNMDDDCCVAGC